MMRRAGIGILIFLLSASGPAAQPAPRYDILITGGQVVDGSGAPMRLADVAIKDGRIAAIGGLGTATARETIRAAGLIVAPGFIDVHTHADDLAAHPRAENFVRMGVTSIVAGNCGTSALDIGEALARIRETGAAVNFATLIGHNTVREAVMGTADRAPSIPELAKMQSLVWRGMTDGAVGLSTGLQYVPGTYAAQPEIIELARTASSAGGLYASHMRNEGTALEAAVLETLRVGEATGARVQISHLKVDSPSRWGDSARALALINAARVRGLTVEEDQYHVHGGELDAGDPLSVVGPRRRSREGGRAAERSGDLGPHQDGDGLTAARAWSLGPLVRRGRHRARGRIPERPVDEADRGEAERA